MVLSKIVGIEYVNREKGTPKFAERSPQNFQSGTPRNGTSFMKRAHLQNFENREKRMGATFLVCTFPKLVYLNPGQPLNIQSLSMKTNENT